MVGGERSNDTLTFEPETNESIVIKLFICLFTIEMDGFGGNGRQSYKGTVREREKDGGKRKWEADNSSDVKFLYYSYNNDLMY